MQKAAPPMSMVILRPLRLLTIPARMEKKAPAGARREESVGRTQQQPSKLMSTAAVAGYAWQGPLMPAEEVIKVARHMLQGPVMSNP